MVLIIMSAIFLFDKGGGKIYGTPVFLLLRTYKNFLINVLYFFKYKRLQKNNINIEIQKVKRL